MSRCPIVAAADMGPQRGLALLARRREKQGGAGPLPGTSEPLAQDGLALLVQN